MEGVCTTTSGFSGSSLRLLKSPWPGAPTGAQGLLQLVGHLFDGLQHAVDDSTFPEVAQVTDLVLEVLLVAGSS
jgi:hypothetical protein